MIERGAWSDCKKWWMDLLKSAIAFTCVSAITVLILWNWEDTRARANHAWQAEHSLKIAAIQEFSRAARLYALWSYDATKERMCGMERAKDNIVSKWQDEGYDNVRIARLSIKTAFPKRDLTSLWSRFDAAQEDVWGKFKQVREKVSSGECKGNSSRKDAAWAAYNKAFFQPALTTYESATEAIVQELLKEFEQHASRS